MSLYAEKVKECKGLIDTIPEEKVDAIISLIKLSKNNAEPSEEEQKTQRIEAQKRKEKWQEWQQFLQDCETQFDQLKEKTFNHAGNARRACIEFMEKNDMINRFIYLYPKRSIESVAVLYIAGYKAGRKAEKKRQIKKAIPEPTKVKE